MAGGSITVIDTGCAKDLGLFRPAPSDRRAVDGLPRRGRRRARPRRAGADLPRLDAARPGAAPGGGAPQLGHHRGRRAVRGPPRHLRRPGRPGRAAGARGPDRLAGRVHAATPRRPARGRPGHWLLDVVARLAGAADLGCRGPAPAPGDHGAHLRRPVGRGHRAAAAGGGGPGRRRGVPGHLLCHDGRLAARARDRRLPRHRGPVLAPAGGRRGSVGHPHPRARHPRLGGLGPRRLLGRVLGR